MHFTTDRVSEDAIVLVTEFAHGEPWCIWVNVVNASDVGDRGEGTGDQLEVGASRRLVVNEEVVEKLHGGDETEDGSTDDPFVGEHGIANFLRLEKRVGGDVVSGHVGLYLGRNDRRRDGRRHPVNDLLGPLSRCQQNVKKRWKGKML